MLSIRERVKEVLVFSNLLKILIFSVPERGITDLRATKYETNVTTFTYGRCLILYAELYRLRTRYGATHTSRNLPEI